MAEKPSYISLLNGISCAESRAGEYLHVWAERTTDPAVKHALTIIAMREAEHGLAFAKRIHELGYEVEVMDDVLDAAGKMEIVCSDCSDYEKAEALGLFKYGPQSNDVPDVFESFFKDKSIDPQTGALLGRYICEERDTGRMLLECSSHLQACATGAAPGSDRFVALESKIDMVCRAVEELRQVVCAQTMPAAV